MRAAVLGAEQSVTGHSFDDGEAYEQFMGRWSREIGKAFLDLVATAQGSALARRRLWHRNIHGADL